MALVFSPIFNAGFKKDLDEFYPGDDYVDWLGVSLYFNNYQLITENGFTYKSTERTMRCSSVWETCTATLC